MSKTNLEESGTRKNLELECNLKSNSIVNAKRSRTSRDGQHLKRKLGSSENVKNSI